MSWFLPVPPFRSRGGHFSAHELGNQQHSARHNSASRVIEAYKKEPRGQQTAQFPSQAFVPRPAWPRRHENASRRWFLWLERLCQETLTSEDSGFRTAEETEEEWATEAQRLIQRYRRAHDFEATRDSQKSCRLKRPFETLETAFQVTCQVMIALLSPRVHPWMRRLSACLRSYPEVLPSPAFSVLVSGFHAKLVLDV
ncbi:unnamed protein product [Symbiodinium sp. CCMP2592]|nr:unnamed protein product [Symbiodinium sp. CCMP2592]